ncbi:flippase [Melioribacteraceae bacterium 4301-Me]|uniref:flippase n=1 Tax=Pyranulibacter aquaticus TaxID=3163344 RepID=UPI003599A738
MLNKLYNSNTKKTLLGNFFSLSILQITNYVLPLVALPYLVRVLGPDKFGLLAFAQAFIQYFNIFIDYGFNFTATRDISINRNSIEKVSEIFSSVLVLKMGFIGLSLLIISLITFSFTKFRNEWLIYFLTFGVVICQNIFPRWLFQGLEKMKYITILNIIAKIIFTLFIFIFIKSTVDYLYVPLINFIGFFVSAVLGLLIAHKYLRVKFIRPSFNELKRQLKEGWYLFISTIATGLYTTSNAFILGIFASNTLVGYFSAAERIIKAIEDLISPVFHSVYPYLSKLFEESEYKAVIFLKKIIRITSIVGVFISLLVFTLANFIVDILLGSSYHQSIIVLKILSLLPFIGGVNIILTSLTLLSFNYKKAFSSIIVGAGISNIIFSFLFVPYYKQIGSCISVILAEVFIMLSTLIYLKRKKIKLI